MEVFRASLTLQETRSINDSMNIPKNEFTQSSKDFSPYLSN